MRANLNLICERTSLFDHCFFFVLPSNRISKTNELFLWSRIENKILGITWRLASTKPEPDTKIRTTSAYHENDRSLQKSYVWYYHSGTDNSKLTSNNSLVAWLMMYDSFSMSIHRLNSEKILKLTTRLVQIHIRQIFCTRI